MSSPSISPARARIIAAEAECALVDVGRVKAGCCPYASVERATKREVSSDAHAHGTETPVTIFATGKVIEGGSRVVVVRRDGFRRLVMVASVGARLIVAEHGARRFELVENLRYDDDEAVARQHRGHSTNRPRPLEDLGEQDDAGASAGIDGTVNVTSHPARCRRQVNRRFFEDHGCYDSARGARGGCRNQRRIALLLLYRPSGSPKNANASSR